MKCYLHSVTVSITISRALTMYLSSTQRKGKYCKPEFLVTKDEMLSAFSDRINYNNFKGFNNVSITKFYGWTITSEEEVKMCWQKYTCTCSVRASSLTTIMWNWLDIFKIWFDNVWWPSVTCMSSTIKLTTNLRICTCTTSSWPLHNQNQLIFSSALYIIL